MAVPAKLARRFALGLLLPLSAVSALGMLAANAEGTQQTAYVAVIIDDIGSNWARGLEAIRLPGPVAISVIPDLPFSTRLAQHAHGRRKDVILHLPMEPQDRTELLPSGGLKTDMTEAQVALSLENGLGSVPYAIAINNHMGSKYTRDRQAVARLMIALQKHNQPLFVIDSLTTPRSQLQRQASAYGIPSLARDVFLDNVRAEKDIEHQFDQVIKIAQKRGYAIAIGHPYPETLSVLQRRLAPLSEGEVRLIPVTMLLAMKIQEREPWH